MTQRRHLANLVAFLGLAAGLTTSTALAQSGAETDPDIRDIRPLVMLLVDTSGSMERVSPAPPPETTPPTPADPATLPMCAGSPPGDNDRNRWTTVLEALTGTWDESDYYCTTIDRSAYTGEQDWNYYLPYNEPPLTATQNLDGILDSYEDRIKFGLMTFDATYTFTDYSHPLLMEESAFMARSDNAGAYGGFSYGGPQLLMYDGCPDRFMVDSGARNASASSGRLISPGDETADHTLINAQIQDALLRVRPFGGTPTAALLQDFEHFLQTDPDVTTDDPFSGCRSRVALLLTDGQPDSDFRDPRYDCTRVTHAEVGMSADPGDPAPGCPYGTPVDIASDLCVADGSGTCTGPLDALYVVALDVADADALAELRSIAIAGGTTEPYLATGSTLRDQISAAIDRAAPGNTTRTRPAFASGTGSVATGGGSTQMEFTAGFEVGVDGAPWQGVLERNVFTCDPSNEPQPEPVAERLRFDEILDARTERRRLLTTLTTNAADMNGNLIGSQAASYPLNATQPPSAQTNRVVAEFNASIGRDYFGVASVGDVADTVSWIRGEATTERADRRMGDIFHSTPVTVGRPSSDIADEAYNLFRASPGVADRPVMVYVGTNDGILHAFAATDWGTNGEFKPPTTDGLEQDSLVAGDEAWGFIPPALMSRLEGATGSHQILLDGTPVVKDVYFQRQPNTTADASLYHTVLVMGFRGGSRGYFALDITYPNAPEFLWQFTGNPDTSSSTPMGASYPEPAVGQVLVEVDGVLQERAVAIIPGGEGELDVAAAAAAGSAGCAHTVTLSQTVGTTSQRTRGRCWQSRGRVLHVVDVGTGQLLRTFDDSFFNAPLTGSVAMTPGDVGSVAQRAFFTDAEGVIWALDMRSPDPAAWEVRDLHDIFWDIPDRTAAQPAYSAPRISSDNAGQLVVMQATGDIDRLDSVAYNRVVSVTETLSYGSTGAPVYGGELNWEIRLQEGEQVTGPLEFFEGTIYFATFESSSDPTDLCALGQSRIWGVSYLENGGLPEAPYNDVLGGYFPTPQWSDGLGGFDHFDGPYSDSLILGVSITQRPTCVTGDDVDDPYIGSRYRVDSVGGGQFQLTAQVSGGSSASEGAIQTITQTLPTPDSFTTMRGFAGQVDY
ncbi:MAG: pilus assembly protein [Sandaracinaceae bacterium]